MRSLLREVAEMPPGYARTATAEEAVRLADAANDLDASFEARVALASAAQHGGEAQKAMVATTWCLGQIDAHPGRFAIEDTYWALKWLPGTLLDLPQVPLTDVERVLAEQRRRYAAEGIGEDAVAKLAWTVPLRTGRVAEAVEAHRRWRVVPRTPMGDCRACDVAAEVDLAIAAGDPARAVDLARPLVAGRLDCAEQPAAVLADLLAPLAELGEHEEAERLHQWGLRLARGNPSLVGAQARHVLHLVRTGRLDDAVDLLAELVDVCDRGLFDVDARLIVLSAGAAVAASLAETGVTETPRPLGARPRDTTALAGLFAGGAREIAAAFDRRNGTDLRTRDAEEWLGVRPVTVVAPPVVRTTSPTLPTTVTVAVVPAVSDEDADTLLELARTPRGPAAPRLAAAERALARYEAAGDAGGAARALATVGEALLRLDRLPEAADALARAVPALTADPVEQVRAALTLARLTAGTAGAVDDEARRWCAVADTAAARAGTPELMAGRVAALRAEWTVLELGEEPAPAGLAAAGAAFADARDLLAADPPLVTDAWASEAWSRSVVGDVAGALQAAETAWEQVRARTDDAGVTDVAQVLVPALLEAGEVDRAIDVLSAVQSSEEALDDPGAAGEAAAARGRLLRDADRLDEALTAAWTAVDLFAGAGDVSSAGWARLDAARLFRDLEEDLSAHDLYTELVERAAEDGDRELEGAASLDLARLLLQHGDVAGALAAAQRAATALPTDEAGARLRVQRTLADVHDAGGQVAEALAAGEAALAAISEEDEDPLLVADVRQEHADRLVVAGRAGEALPLYASARDAYTDAGQPVGVAATGLREADALHALGRTAEAISLAEEAVAVGHREDVLALVADALWAVASFSPPEAVRYDTALQAYQAAGAPAEQLAELTAARDRALKRGRSRWRR
ncbi:hypothetical protein IN07_24290 [Modestobacter caceresii]|uniref:Tetratricopeptide repeat protein n=1 Tax=Modestobacter caceresii TaxID=1522368 RepID=A0A098Y065_9ACTN|nr:hypothetical protein IN07_24290 [Modestobacter caceresii]